MTAFRSTLAAAACALFCAAPVVAEEKAPTPTLADGKSFTDCETTCPAMVPIPGSDSARIGSPENEPGRVPSEALHTVTIKPFALGKYEVRVAEYMACVAESACRDPEWREAGGEHHIETGRGVTYKSIKPWIIGDDQPVVGVSWDDAVAYANYLAKKTGKPYRLPSEAEWEYAARAGTDTPFWWGSDPKRGDEVMGCCRGCGSELDAKGFFPVQSFKPNPWGLHNMNGNVWEWVQDYYCEAYDSAPSDGRARADKACPKVKEGDVSPDTPDGLRVFRGGSCFYEPRQMRASMRLRNWPMFRNQTLGFRVARDLTL